MKKYIAGLMALLVVLAGCGTSLSGSSVSSSAEAQKLSVSEPATVDSSGVPSNAVVITLSGQSASASGSGVTIDGGTVTITAGGSYVLRGELTDGTVLINATKEASVVLYLDGAQITSSTTAAIFCKKAKSLTVVLSDGSANTLTDASSYVYADGEDEPDAALYSKCDLVISGSGALTVKANYADGIKGKDTLSITGGQITVNAADDGIIGRDSAQIFGGTFVIQCAGDGIKTTNDEDASLGYLYIEDGSFEITSGGDGIQAETDAEIAGGVFQIASGGGSAASLAADASAKGIKAGGGLLISGGTFAADCADDALHASGDLTISGGTFVIASGDDGVHSDGALLISAGSVLVTKSYEGLEGKSVTVSGGSADVTSTDDGVNAAGGTADNHGGTAVSGCSVNVTGGTLRVNANGDGLDSNGDLTISGGEIYVDGPTNSGNGALDYNGSCTVTGGTLVAAGSSGMATAPGSASTQCSLMVTFTSEQAAGTAFELRDSSGNTVLSYTPAKKYSNIVVSCPALADGQTYTILLGGSEYGTVTLSGVTTTSGSAGGMGGMGGGMGGGNRPGNQQGTAPDAGSAPTQGTTPTMPGDSDASSSATKKNGQG